jgi:aminomethyltransferase
MEYHAIRHSAGLIDVSPLKKYHVTGRDAARLVNKVVTRDIAKLAPGQIYYTPWCDGRGKTVDDGTVWNLGDGSYRITAAEPNKKWIEDCGFGMETRVEDVSDEVAALALQGPTSRAILAKVAGAAIEGLRYYRFTGATLDGIPATISRTGYTGDLGFEVWLDPRDAPAAWDLLMARGQSFGIAAVGMEALEVARIEAGLILVQVDYMPSRTAMIDAQAYSPFELSLDWTVALDKGPFVGRRALQGEKRRGPSRRLVGLEVDWRTAEGFYRELGLPPEPPRHPWRGRVPIYAGSRQVGKATSGVWSPLLKKYVVLATVETPWTQLGTSLLIEITVEGQTKRAPARVVKRPFFDPERKRA